MQGEQSFRTIFFLLFTLMMLIRVVYGWQAWRRGESSWQTRDRVADREGRWSGVLRGFLFLYMLAVVAITVIAPAWAGLFAKAAVCASLCDVEGTGDVIERHGGEVAGHGPIFQSALGVNKDGADIATTVALHAFVHMMLPVLSPLCLGHFADLFKFFCDGFFMSFFGRGLGLSLFFVDAGHCGGFGIFLFACTGTVTALDAFDLIDGNTFDP